ncbi:hypothetical protein MLD38_019270 [Melastoma candidum]|uniref:Uncharacterized protein n=2 Tax=Melastoma candidum TaxID=119954 RepID=A0ACB9QZJ5_9MYRT|nr:hypothetical protein MLD38_019270 [Melastoma candidum]
MLLRFWLPKRSCCFSQGFRAGRCFSEADAEDILAKALSVQLRQRKWKPVERLLQNSGSSLVTRVIREVWDSPQLALEFYWWIVKDKRVPFSLEVSCAVLNVLVRGEKFDDALRLMETLICAEGISPLEISEELLRSYDTRLCSPAVFDALIRMCGQLGATEDAYRLICKLRLKNIKVTVHAWNNFLSHLLKSNNLGKFWMMYRKTSSFGYSENVYTLNLAIHALSRDYMLSEALSVFYRMLKGGIWPNTVTFNMIIDGACRTGDMELALKLLRKMRTMSGGCVRPNSVTFNSIINGFSKMGSMALAEAAFNEMIAAGSEVNVRTYGALIDGYSREGNLDNAFKLCDQMVEQGFSPNVAVYNSFLFWLYRDQDMEGASLLLSDMLDKKIIPDHITYTIIIEGLCRNGYLNEALNIHKLILEKGLVDDNFSHNVLINYIWRNKQDFRAQQLTASMIVRGVLPDVITYGTLIDKYCKEGDLGAAIQAYDTIVASRQSPNLVVYNTVLNGFCRAAKMVEAEALVNSLHEVGLSDSITLNTLLNGYYLSGDVDKALCLVSEYGKLGIRGDIVTWNILINWLCKFGAHLIGKEMMMLMIERGLVPDARTYTMLITNFRKRCAPEEVIELHDYMVINGVVPDSKTYQAIVKPLLGEIPSVMSEGHNH